MKNKKEIVGFIVVIVIVALSFFIYKNTNKGIEKTSLRLKWIAQAQFAGFYTANQKGYYKDAGLDVTINPAGPNISPIQSVATGNDEFGIAGADQIIAAIDNGVPIVVGYFLMIYIFKIFVLAMDGYFSFYMKPVSMILAVVYLLVGYAFVSVIDYIRIKKVPMSEALKNVD